MSRKCKYVLVLIDDVRKKLEPMCCPEKHPLLLGDFWSQCYQCKQYGTVSGPELLSANSACYAGCPRSSPSCSVSCSDVEEMTFGLFGHMVRDGLTNVLGVVCLQMVQACSVSFTCTVFCVA